MIDQTKVCIGPWPEEYEPILCEVCQENGGVWVRFDRGQLSCVFCDSKECRRSALPEIGGEIPKKVTSYA